MLHEERLALKIGFEKKFGFIETSRKSRNCQPKIDSKFKQFSLKEVIFIDDITILEPGRYFGSRNKIYISLKTKNKSCKYILVKRRFLDRFEKLVSVYSEESKQHISLLSEERVYLGKESFFLFKTNKCNLKFLPNKLNLPEEELIENIKSKFEVKTNEIVLKKFKYRGKVKQLTNTK